MHTTMLRIYPRLGTHTYTHNAACSNDESHWSWTERDPQQVARLMHTTMLRIYPKNNALFKHLMLRGYNITT